jgi:hypothetical protein
MKYRAASIAIQPGLAWYSPAGHPYLWGGVVAILVVILISRLAKARRVKSHADLSLAVVPRRHPRIIYGWWSGRGLTIDPAVVNDTNQATGNASSYTSDVEPSSSQFESATQETALPVPSPDALPQSTSRQPVEKALVAAANAIIGTGTQDRQVSRRQLEDNPGIRLYSPTRTTKTAALVYSQYWFEEDERGATWLGAPAADGSGLRVVPIDFRGYERDAAMTYLGTLFDGVAAAQEAVRRGAVTITAAAHLTQSPDGSYQVTSRGSLGVRGTAATPPEGIATADEETGSHPNKLAKRVQKVERTLHEFSQDISRRMSDLGSEVRRIAAAKSDSGRLDGIERRQTELENSLNEIKRLLRQKGEVQTKAPGETSQAPAALASRTIFPGTVALPDVPLLAAESPTSPPVPPLPPDWRARLIDSAVEGDFSNSQTYARAVQSAVSEFSRSDRGRGKAVVAALHLVSIGTEQDKKYHVHLRDVFADASGVLVMECAERPGTLTPADQFFICFTDGADNPAQISVVCPVGTYGPRFDFGALIEQIPDDILRVNRVIEPALLVALRDGSYRVAHPMETQT